MPYSTLDPFRELTTLQQKLLLLIVTLFSRLRVSFAPSVPLHPLLRAEGRLKHLFRGDLLLIVIFFSLPQCSSSSSMGFSVLSMLP